MLLMYPHVNCKYLKIIFLPLSKCHGHFKVKRNIFLKKKFSHVIALTIKNHDFKIALIWIQLLLIYFFKVCCKLNGLIKRILLKKTYLLSLKQWIDARYRLLRLFSYPFSSYWFLFYSIISNNTQKGTTTNTIVGCDAV